MTHLTEEMRRELRAAGDRPLRLSDPDTRCEYVLLRAELYDQLRALLDAQDYDPAAGAALMNEVMAEDDRHDQYLESYQQLGTP